MEKFDFSKIEDQKKFDNLPEKEREEIVDGAYKKAYDTERVIDSLIYHLESYSVNDISYFKVKYDLTEEMFWHVVKKSITRDLSYYDYLSRDKTDGVDKAIRIKDKCNLPEDVFRQAVRDGIAGSLLSDRTGSVEHAIRIKDKFNLPEDVFQSNEFKEVLKEVIISRLSKEVFSENEIIKIKDNFNLQEDVLRSNEVQEAAQKAVVSCLSHNYFGSATVIKNGFNLTEDIFQEAVKESLIRALLSRRERDYYGNYYETILCAKLPRLKTILICRKK